MQAVIHFYDQYKSKLYLDDGRVLTAGNAQAFTVDRTDKLMEAMERVLKRKGIIAERDSLSWVQ